MNEFIVADLVSLAHQYFILNPLNSRQRNGYAFVIVRIREYLSNISVIKNSMNIS